MNATFSLSVSAKHSGLSLHDFLTLQFPFFQVSNWPETIVEGSLTIDHQYVTGNPIVQAGMQVGVTLCNYSEAEVNDQWRTYWENEDLLIAHKPALLPVHNTTRNRYNTFTDLIRRAKNLPEAQVLHRLDLETAGLVLLAKHKPATLAWQPKLKDILKKKVYRAIVWGAPSWKQNDFSNYLVQQNDSEIRCKMYNDETGETGKLCQTRFTVVHSSGEFSELECELVTGRKHQIRAQLAHLGHPIVGDKIYAHEGEFYLKRLADDLTQAHYDMIKTPHHLLVAFSLTLTLPNTPPTTITLNADDYPDAWQTFLAQNPMPPAIKTDG